MYVYTIFYVQGIQVLFKRDYFYIYKRETIIYPYTCKYTIALVKSRQDLLRSIYSIEKEKMLSLLLNEELKLRDLYMYIYLYSIA